MCPRGAWEGSLKECHLIPLCLVMRRAHIYSSACVQRQHTACAKGLLAPARFAVWDPGGRKLTCHIRAALPPMPGRKAEFGASLVRESLVRDAGSAACWLCVLGRIPQPCQCLHCPTCKMGVRVVLASQACRRRFCSGFLSRSGYCRAWRMACAPRPIRVC